MPITVRQLFQKVGIIDFKKVKWGEEFSEKGQGVYIVSTSNSSDGNLGTLAKPVFDDRQINTWINKLPDFRVDNNLVTPDILKDRLSKFWLADESILYIGKAENRKTGSGIGKRVKEYYITEIGNGSPHSGGQWIKVLENIDSLYVYYGVCDNPKVVENKMLEYFMQNVSVETLERLFDPKLPLPFANIKFSKNKKHGLYSQRL